MIGKIKMARDWFGRICVVLFLRLVGVRGSGPPVFSFPGRVTRQLGTQTAKEVRYIIIIIYEVPTLFPVSPM